MKQRSVKGGFGDRGGRSPQDDELRSSFYRDDPAWFLQVRR